MDLNFDICVICVTSVFYALLSHGEREFYARFRVRIEKTLWMMFLQILYRTGLTLTSWTLGFMCVVMGVKYALHAEQLVLSH